MATCSKSGVDGDLVHEKLEALETEEVLFSSAEAPATTNALGSPGNRIILEIPVKTSTVENRRQGARDERGIRRPRRKSRTARLLDRPNIRRRNDSREGRRGLVKIPRALKQGVDHGTEPLRQVAKRTINRKSSHGGAVEKWQESQDRDN
jgi:hypothetical protein